MVKIAYKLVNGIILIPVKANEQVGYFAFDTGAMQTAVNRSYFPELQGEHVDIAKFSEGVKESVADKGMLNTLRFSETERTTLDDPVFREEGPEFSSSEPESQTDPAKEPSQEPSASTRPSKNRPAETTTPGRQKRIRRCQETD